MGLWLNVERFCQYITHLWSLHVKSRSDELKLSNDKVDDPPSNLYTCRLIDLVSLWFLR